ncbi:hypothetical protein [Streptomyces sp. H51]|uniref:hypothetical protein n=1 Tax=Streptomyces sp. H51 TaxID=3111770 RepID=UPI003B63CAF3
MDPKEVAEGAGNSVAVLLSREAKFIDGRQEIVYRKIGVVARVRVIARGALGSKPSDSFGGFRR